MTRNAHLVVRDYMSTDLFVATPAMSIHRATELMITHQVSGLPVVDDRGDLIGILSERDALGVAFRSTYHQHPEGTVADFMKTEVETLNPDTEIAPAISKFIASPYRRFPVVEGPRLVGILGRRDALRAVRDLW